MGFTLWRASLKAAEKIRRILKTDVRFVKKIYF
jgi:hypothetical protein